MVIPDIVIPDIVIPDIVIPNIDISIVDPTIVEPVESNVTSVTYFTMNDITYEINADGSVYLDGEFIMEGGSDAVIAAFGYTEFEFTMNGEASYYNIYNDGHVVDLEDGVVIISEGGQDALIALLTGSVTVIPDVITPDFYTFEFTNSDGDVMSYEIYDDGHVIDLEDGV